MDDPRICVIGAGPKAMALAAKAKVLRDLGLPSVSIQIVDRHSVAANWLGAAGYTDGEQSLGTPPEKDVGFPYTSVFGSKVDQGMLEYSWQAFRVDSGDYHCWIDRGKPAPSHKLWGEYLLWIASKTGVSIDIARVKQVEPVGTRWKVELETGVGELKVSHVDGLVLTGPGKPVRLPGDIDGGRVLDGRMFWMHKEQFAHVKPGSHEPAHIAVIGSGETAASIVLAVARMNPHLRIDLINRHGTIYTRGESYHENLLYTNAARWLEMEEIEREEFIHRTDRGVFSVEAQRLLDHMGAAPNIFIITGDVRGLQDVGTQVQVLMQRRGKLVPLNYEYVIVAIGFDPFSALTLLPECEWRDSWIAGLRKCPQVDEHMRVMMPIGTGCESVTSTLHVPMIAGLHQGPGFPNLSCLGTLADRIISAYAVK